MRLCVCDCARVKTLNVHDMVNFKCMVFMYKIYNKLLPANIVILQKNK